MIRQFCTLALAMAVSLVLAPAVEAQVYTWTLSGVTLADGGTVSGSFDYDYGTSTVTSWSLSVSGGSEGTFPPLTYDGSNSVSSVYDGGDPEQRIQFSENGTFRQLRMTPEEPLDGNGFNVPLNLSTANGGSGGVECFNCSPSRLIDAGALNGAPVPVELQTFTVE